MSTWKVVCDRTGTDIWASDSVREWNGLIVDRRHADERHPQDFVRGKKDRQRVRDPRPEPTDVFQTPGMWWFTDYDQSGEILTIGL